MNVISRLFPSAQGNILKVTARGVERELPQREVYKMLWWYYLNNGLYDQLRQAGYYTNDAKLKALRNPAGRVVEFYVDTIMPGRLDQGLPLATDNDNLRGAIEKLWNWSNWEQKKQVMIRWGAITGDVYIKVAQPVGKQRLYLELIDPMFVSDRSVDERGYVTYIRIDVPVDRRNGDKVKQMTYTEVWDLERGARIWTHDKSYEEDLVRLGEPDEEYPLSTWGIDFIPFVHTKHIDIGHEYGIGAYQLQLEKMDELNIQATQLHKIMFRHNNVTWALQANMSDSTGRPLPAPRIGAGGDDSTVELSGETIIKLPGFSTLVPMVPTLDYSAYLDAVGAQVDELSEDLPEMLYYKIKQMSDMSGVAIRSVMTPAIKRADEARGNYESGLIRAQKMALTIGKNLRLWEKDPGNYEAGDFEHTFEKRPIMPMSHTEKMEVIKSSVDSGIPLVTAVRRAGWSEEEIEQLQTDLDEAKESEKTSLASALMSASAGLTAGRQSNGLEQGLNNDDQSMP